MILDQHVRLVQMQFSFSNPKIIPTSVRRFNSETDDERSTRKSRIPGIQFIPPTINTSILGFATQLEACRYELVDSFYKPRLEERSRQTYHMIRFVFAREEDASISDTFYDIRNVIRSDLWKMCHDSLWRVRAYDNPFYMDDQNSPERTVSINMEAREPLYLPDGQLIKARRKNEQGQPIGEPVPISPSHRLKIVKNKIDLMKLH